jgi:hypothetical protein
MAAEIVEYQFNVMHLVPLMVKAMRAAAGDWIVLSGFKGVIPLAGIGQSIAASLSETVPTWGVATVTPTCTTSTTEFAVTSATITRKPPFYVATAGGEILEVISETAADNANSTWTVRRGCLGTTASATGLAATNVVGIMNIIFMAGNNVGPNFQIFYPLPNDPGVKMYYTTA